MQQLCSLVFMETEILYVTLVMHIDIFKTRYLLTRYIRMYSMRSVTIWFV